MVLSAENFPFLFVHGLARVYMALTICKLIQLTFCKWRKMQGKKNLYAPSVTVFIYLVGWFVAGGQHVSKIPRKDLRVVSDTWIQDYNQKHSPHTTAKVEKKDNVSPQSTNKVYKSKKEAIGDFFKQFTKDSSPWYVALSKHGVQPYFRHPLGLCIVIEMAICALAMPSLMIREMLILSAVKKTDETNAMEACPVVLCKVAAAATITDVFVVACKEKMPFEKALHAYPWVQHVFTRPQTHPMVGRAVCPAYKRNVHFPYEEVTMDFDVELLTCKSGTPLLRQKHDTLLADLKEDLVLSYVLLAFALLTTVWSVVWYSSEPTLALRDLGYKVLPHAAMFYGVRAWSDKDLKIEWLPRYKFLP